jgi:translation elongation factor EF-Tu-like GTPase
MARRLFVVEDTFFIKGRGLIPVPGIIPRGNERFRVGDPIVLQRPDGSTLAWRIGGLEMIHTAVPRDDVVILLSGLAKEDVPIGTEVWSVNHARVP